MRNRKTQGFTLIELLIVIAIIGILAAVLIPNLLSARARAFDTSAQACLKEIATIEEAFAIDAPFEYISDEATVVADANACDGVTVTSTGSTAAFAYEAFHPNGQTTYSIAAGGGVTNEGATPAP